MYLQTIRREYDHHRERVGEIGESFVADFFGKNYVKSPDKYDQHKDCYVCDWTAEIKTTRYNFKTKGFWVPQSQFYKLDNADILIFIRIPEQEKDPAVMYHCKKHKSADTYTIIHHEGKTNRSYKLTNCQELCIIKNELSVEMHYHSNAMRKWRKQ